MYSIRSKSYMYRFLSIVVFFTASLFFSVAFAQQVLLSDDGVLKKLKSYPKVHELVLAKKFDEATIAMLEERSQNEHFADYHYLLGELQLKQKDFQSAADSFERAVLIDPRYASAWMDLAIANVEIGNLISAKNYFNHIEATFNPPPQLLSYIAAYRKKIDALQEGKKTWRLGTDIAYGVDSNANSGLRSSSISLTLGSERFDLLLDPNYKARQDQFGILGLDASYLDKDQDSAIEFRLAARQRSFKTERAYSSSELSSGFGGQKRLPWGMLGATIQVDQVQLGDKGIMRNASVNSSFDRTWSSCQVGGGLSYEFRRYANYADLNANILWAQFVIACETMLGRLPIRSSVVTRHGVDEAIGLRAGSNTIRNELALKFGLTFYNRFNLDLSGGFANAKDVKGYSELLENNAPRDLTRRSYRVQMTTKITTNSEIVLKYDFSQMDANIDLFKQSGRAISLGMRAIF